MPASREPEIGELLGSGTSRESSQKRELSIGLFLCKHLLLHSSYGRSWHLAFAEEKSNDTSFLWLKQERVSREIHLFTSFPEFSSLYGILAIIGVC